MNTIFHLVTLVLIFNVATVGVPSDDHFGNIAVRLFEVGLVIFEKNAIIQEPKNNIDSWEDSAKAFHKNAQKMIS